LHLLEIEIIYEDYIATSFQTIEIFSTKEDGTKDFTSFFYEIKSQKKQN